MALLPHDSQGLSLVLDPGRPGKKLLLNGLTGECLPVQQEEASLHYSKGRAFLRSGASTEWVSFALKVFVAANGKQYFQHDGKVIWASASHESAAGRYLSLQLPGVEVAKAIKIMKVPLPVEGCLLYWQLRDAQDLHAMK